MSSSNASWVRWLARLGWAVWLGCAGYVVVELVRTAIEHPQGEGDTGVLLHGAFVAYRCLTFHVTGPCPNVQHFPLLQYVPSVALYALHWDIDSIASVLSKASLISLPSMMVLTGWAWRRTRTGPVLGALCVLCGYGIWYYQSTFGEPLAGALTLGMACAVLWGRSAVLVAVLMVLAGISKEVAAPFLIALGVLPLIARTAGPRELVRTQWRMWVALGIGALGSIALNAAFNEFRFGGLTNTFLMRDVLHVQTIGQQLIYFAGLWASPNGGLLLFAVPFSVLLFGVGGQVLVAVARKRRTLWWATPMLLLLVIWLGLTLGFARWFSPFGWWAWGPRLCWPWVPVTVALIGAIYGPEVDRLFAPLFARWWTFVPVAVAFALACVPHLAMDRTPDVFRQFFQYNPECHGDPDVMRHPADFYACINRMIFPEQLFVLPRVFALMFREDMIRICAALAVAIVGMAALVRRRLRRASDAAPREVPAASAVSTVTT